VGGGFGEGAAHAEAGGEQGSFDLLARDLDQFGYLVCRISLDIAEQEDDALVGGEFLEGFFEIGAANIAALQARGVGGFDGFGDLVNGKALAEFVDHGSVDTLCIGLFFALESADKGVCEDFFGFDFVTGHVVSDGEGAMAMGLVHVALALLEGAHLALLLDNSRATGGGKLSIQIEQDDLFA